MTASMGRSSPTGVAPAGTARRAAPTGRSTRRNTRTRASTDRSTRHGPGERYVQDARGRRDRRRSRTGGSAGSTGAAPPERSWTRSARQASGTRRPAGRRPIAQPAAGPTHTTSSWWDSTTGPAAGRERHGANGRGPICHRDRAMGRRPSSGVRRRRRRPTSVALPRTSAARSPIERLRWRPRTRGRAFLGWLPIAFGVSWLVGEITGCGRFAATCDGSRGSDRARSSRSRSWPCCWSSRCSRRSRRWAHSRCSPPRSWPRSSCRRRVRGRRRLAPGRARCRPARRLVRRCRRSRSTRRFRTMSSTTRPVS